MASTIAGPVTDHHMGTHFPQFPADPAPAGRVESPRVIVVIPCFNEEVSIGSVILRSAAYADQVVVVDDGSSDKTADIARMAGARIISHGINKGKGAGIRSAFEYAKKAGAGVLVLLDGDGQHNPDEIPLLVEPILKGEVDMVNGSRFLEKSNKGIPRYRRIGQEVLTTATNIGSGQKITDSQSGFRAFSPKTYDLFSFHEIGMGIESQMLMEAGDAHLAVKEVPISVRYDVDGSTYNPVAHGFRVLGSVMEGIVKRRQALVYGIPGLLLLSIGIIAFNILTLSDAPIGYTTVSLLSIILGMLCIFTLMVIKATQGTASR